MTAEIEAIDQMLKHGRIREARVRFDALLLKRRSLGREHLWFVANLAWRFHLPKTAISILHRFVRPAPRSPLRATPAEILEYAIALADLGATREALELLDQVDGEEFPDVYFSKGRIHLKMMEYREAIPFFEKVATHPKWGKNGQLNGKVFLATCLYRSSRDKDRAVRVLEEILRETSPSSYGYHYANASLVLAQIAVESGDREAADRHLRALEELVKDGADEVFPVLARMWRAIHEGDAVALEGVRRELEASADHARARNCDYHLARMTGDRRRLAHVFFGSPFPAVRGKVAHAMAGAESLPREYPWIVPMGTNARSNGRSVTVFAKDGTNDARGGSFVVGAIPHRLFSLLCSDFYASFRLSEIAEHVCPGERYNPVTTPNRVHQWTSLLREWFEEQGIPLTVSCDRNGLYRLEATGPCAVIVERERLATLTPWAEPEPESKGTNGVRISYFVQRAYGRCSSQPFTSAGFAEIAGLSTRSALRMLAEAVAAGLVERSGRGRSVSYRIPGPAAAPAPAAESARAAS